MPYRYGVRMQEPGYVAIKCEEHGHWDQFPMFEGKVWLEELNKWADDHEMRYHAVRALDDPH